MKNFNTPVAIIIAAIVISITLLYSSTKDQITNCMKLVMDNSNISANCKYTLSRVIFSSGEPQLYQYHQNSQQE